MESHDNRPDDFPADLFRLVAFCTRCGHSAAIDRHLIPARLPVQALPSRLRCTNCGVRQATIRIVYTGAGGFRYGVAASSPTENAS